MSRFSRYDSDEERLPEGMTRVGYDADTQVTTFQDVDGNDAAADVVDPESHLHYINAFDMPLWHWSHEKSAFEL